MLIICCKGAQYADQVTRIQVAPKKVKVVDTTGAGDTFIGYLLASLQIGKTINESLEAAKVAAAISVTRKGAATSIPFASEIKSSAFAAVGG